MSDNLVDLLLTTSVVLPVFLIVAVIVGLVVYAVTHFWPDDSDHTSKEDEELRQTRLQERLAEEPAEPTLAEFYNTYDEPHITTDDDGVHYDLRDAVEGVPPILPTKPKRKPRTKKVA